MSKILLPTHHFTFEEIQKGQWSEEDPYFRDSLLFCQEWLNGQDTFELMTSGSTGTPKKILVNRLQMEISAKATGSFFGIERRSKIFCCLHTGMIAGKMMLVRGLCWNAEILLVKPQENPLSELKMTETIDFAAMVPMQVKACLEQDLPKLQKIKTLIIGGAPSAPALIEQILEAGLNAYQTYGMTETVSHIALAKIKQAPLVYTVLPGVEIGTDHEQRLWIKAPMAREEILQTNDLVEILNNSQFRWLGRADFTINSGGIKIQPEILESKIQPTLEKPLGGKPFFISGIPDEKLGEKLVLVLESENLGMEFSQKLLQELKNILPKYHIPKAVFYVTPFVRTASGKINRPQTLKNIP